MIILSLIETIPYILTILFPNICYGCTKIGKLHQELNVKIKLSYIAWLAYIGLFLYFSYLTSSIKNQITKYILIIFFIFMIYIPVFPIMNLINLVLFSVYNNPPFIHIYDKIFPASIEIEKNSNTIIDEFKKFAQKNKADCLRKTNPGFTIENNSNDENCWRALFLKKIGKIDNKFIEDFPVTIKLLKDKQIHNAFFSILDSGVEIPPHTGYYKGYLRYHLGIIIPNNNKEKAYIVCGGKKYIWKKGKGILFDDLYLHYVKNPTNQTRVVLYLDIKRKSNLKIIDIINDIGLYFIENSIILNRFIKNQHNQIKIYK